MGGPKLARLGRFLSQRDQFRPRFRDPDSRGQPGCRTYGDGLDPEALHPYMWAAKPHYYGRAFYNFPYMFGLLFALGLYAVYRQEGEAFVPRYDELLSSTGLADAATLADRFGIDIRTPDFWRASLGTIREDIDRFESLVS